MKRIEATVLVLAAALPLLGACKPMPAMAGPSPSTQAGIENDIMANRPASNVGLAPPIDITQPTP